MEEKVDYENIKGLPGKIMDLVEIIKYAFMVTMT